MSRGAAESKTMGERSRSREKMTLDNYIDFIDSHRQLDLAVHHLNEIIGMHGFKKIYKTQKKVLIDVVKSMELMDPCRSTLQNGDVSSCALITLEEAIMDLADLKWQECCVTSIQTLISVKYDLCPQNGGVWKSKSRSPKRLRRFRDVEDDGTTAAPKDALGGGTVSTAAAGSQSASASACSPAIHAMQLAARAKRKTVRGEGDRGFRATFGDVSLSVSTFV